MAQPSSRPAAGPPPLSAYGNLPAMEDAAISPDGSRVALLTTIDGARTLVVMTATGEPVRRILVENEKVRSLAWGGNDRVIVQTSVTQNLYGFTADKAEFTGTTVLPVAPDQKLLKVFSSRRDLIDATFGNYGVRKVNERWYGYYGAVELASSGGEYRFDHGRPNLYRVDLVTGRPEQIESAPPENVYRDWLVGPDGSVVARLDIDRTSGKWSIKSRGAAIASGQSVTADITLLAIGAEGTGVLYATDDGSGDRQWYEVPMAGGAAEVFRPDEQIERLYVDPVGGSLLGYLKRAETLQPVFFDKAMQASANKIQRAFAKYHVSLIDFTPDFAKALVRTSGNKDSGTWFIVDLASLRANAIGYERMAIGPDHVGPISRFEYVARDGQALDGVLTLPPGKKAENLPLVMLPHGGPHAQNRVQFDWWAQAFASRGYAVLQPNFRGSTNRDDAFRRAGYGEWGGKMQSDLSDGVKALADKGIVDPKRACIVGASYGGYAALAGVTLQQGIYRCAVSVAGVSDLNDMYTEDLRIGGEARTMRVALLEQLGPRDRWAERSPKRKAG